MTNKPLLIKKTYKTKHYQFFRQCECVIEILYTSPTTKFVQEEIFDRHMITFVTNTPLFYSLHEHDLPTLLALFLTLRTVLSRTQRPYYSSIIGHCLTEYCAVFIFLYIIWYLYPF